VTDPRPEVIDEIPARIADGYSSFKLFTTYDGVGIDDAAIYDVLRTCGSNGALVFVHCENDTIVRRRTKELLDAGRTEPRWHPVARPAEAEAEAIDRVIALAHAAGSPVYIAHVSSRAGLDRLERAQRSGQSAFGETCPHYLGLTEAVYDQPGFGPARYLCSPPMRGAGDQQALWDGLAAGVLSVVSSDHGPLHLSDRQRLGEGDFSRIPNGAGSAEHLRHLLWTDGVVAGRLSVERFVEVTATGPAVLFGLRDKGRVAVGMDADIVVWDPRVRWTAASTECTSRLDYCVFEGRGFTGAATATVRRGELLWDGREVVGRSGSGRFVPRFAEVPVATQLS
jgi:dihydropyrimidinase